MPEPIAIVGMAALYPQARDVSAFWNLLTEQVLDCPCGGPASAGPPDRRRCGPAGSARQGDTCRDALDDVDVDIAAFRVPPAQAPAMARLQMLMLHAAGQCLDDAKAGGAVVLRENTDVVVATCGGLDRQYANALRVEASRYARSLGRALEAGGDPPPRAAEIAAELLTATQRRLGMSAHDRIGEMASTIPARVASAFALRGRTLAVEAADASSFVALAHAIITLRDGTADAAMVIAGQRRESALLGTTLAAKGVLTGRNHPFADDGAGFALGEGVGAVLLKRLSSAVRDGDRVYALIRECALDHQAHPGTFRYSTAEQDYRAVAARAYQRVGVDPAAVQYVECFGAGTPTQAQAELAALAAVLADADHAPVVLGSARDRLGHTFANAGLASVTKVALALHHRTVPPQWLPSHVTAGNLAAAGFRTAVGPERWRPGRGGTPRVAAVNGAAITGTLCHLVMEEYDPAPPADRGYARPAPGRAMAAAVRPITVRPMAVSIDAAPVPVAVVAAAARYAGPPGAAGFARTVTAGQDQIRPLPAARFDRELFYRPDMVSLAHSYTELGAAVDVPRRPPTGLAVTPARFAGMDDAQRLALVVASELLGAKAAGTRPLTGPGLVAVGTTLCLGAERAADVAREMATVESAVAELGGLANRTENELDAIRKLAREDYGEPPRPGGTGWLDGFLASGTAAAIAAEYRLGAVPVAVEAACASALAAVDLAVGALRSGAVDYALAGGVELACTARDLVLCSALGLLSRSRITPFDRAADGFSPGDGCGLFLLKRLDDARRDRDQVLGLIRGVGAANDAKSQVAPDRDGQALAMRRAFRGLPFGPETVDYLEAHGTGTKLGDQVELDAVHAVYGPPRRSRPLAVGSAKSLFGHTFAAAGAAGLLRALQAIGQRTLPPSAGLTVPSPELPLTDIPAFVSARPVPWPAPAGHPRRAAVSSFGTGGINYHIVIEEPDGL